jgi:hypothetical protein
LDLKMNGSQFWELYQSYGDVYRQEVLNEEVEMEELDEVTGGGLIKGSSTSYAGTNTLNPKTGYESNLSAAQKRRGNWRSIVAQQGRGEIKPEPSTTREIQAQKLAGFRNPQRYSGGVVPRRNPGEYSTSHEGISPEGTPSGLSMTPRARAEGRAKSLDVKGGKYTRAANRIRRELETNKNLNASYEYDLYDVVLEHLLDEGFADTLEDAQVLMANMSEQWIDSIVEEAEEGMAVLRHKMKIALQKNDKEEIKRISGILSDRQQPSQDRIGAELRGLIPRKTRR